MNHCAMSFAWSGCLLSSLFACAPIDTVVGSNAAGVTGGTTAQAQTTPNTTADGQGGQSSLYDKTAESPATGGVASSFLSSNGVGGISSTSYATMNASGGTRASSSGTEVSGPKWTPRVPPEVLPVSGTGPLSGVWYGAIQHKAPGSWGPPLDFVTLVLDEGHLRSFIFQNGFRTDIVRPNPSSQSSESSSAPQYTVDFETFTESGFEVQFRTLDSRLGINCVESLRGDLQVGQLVVNYSLTGNIYAGTVAQATDVAVLNRIGAARPIYNTLHGVWYGVVNTTAPGFAGTPEDQMALVFDDQAILRKVQFTALPMVAVTFGDADGEFPLSGSRFVQPTDSANSYDAEVQRASFGPATVDFAIRLKSHDANTAATDVLLSVTGQLKPTGLVVDYHYDGQLWGAIINAHAEGRLLP